MIKLLIALFLFLILCFTVLNIIYPLPRVEIDVATVVVDRNDAILRQFSNNSGVYRHLGEINENNILNNDYKKLLINYEDKYFYIHLGINPFAMIRALYQWIKNGAIISGGSTITMQVARLLYPHERSLFGKLIQIFRSLQLEIHYSKNEILQFYINLAPMGGNIEGIEAASWRYFGKTSQSLNLAQSALLVVLPQRPSIYRPDLNLEHAKNARNKVLKRGVDDGIITEHEFRAAINTPLILNQQYALFHAPLLSERLKNIMPTESIIRTTIDKTLQLNLERLILRKSKQLSPALSVAVLVVNHQNNEIRAWVGSPDLFDSRRFGYIDMVTHIRSPGSTLKPFIYGMAMDQGIIHEASLLIDTQRNFNGYVPQNFDQHFNGAVTVKQALQKSLNVPAVQVMSHLTPHFFSSQLIKCGIQLKAPSPNLSLALGGVGMNLYDLVRLYTSIAHQGKIYPLTVLRDSSDKMNRIASRNIMNEGAIKSIDVEAGCPFQTAEANWIITKILTEMKPPDRIKKRNIAWKTGTSYGYRDAWSIGTSPDWTVGVWIGRPDGVPNIGGLGVKVSAPLMFDIFELLPNDGANFQKPHGIVPARICWPSGRDIVQVDPTYCEQYYDIDSISNKIPPTLYDAVGESAHGGWPSALRGGQQFENQIDILQLSDQSVLFKSNQKMLLKSTGKPPLRWYLDGVLLADISIDLGTLVLGKHTISVVDSYNRKAMVRIDVREFKPFD